MRHVQRDGYHLLDWPGRTDLFISELWCVVPELVLGHYLVNTSFDSGSLCLTPEEIMAGWKMVGTLAHSPQITTVSQIPHDQFDEWLVFDSPVEITGFETMVNYSSFTPIDFGWEERRKHYWRQIIHWKPQHVLAENECVCVVTRDEDIVHKLQHV